jgi:hypothetical protein
VTVDAIQLMSDETIPYLVMVENIQQMSDETIPL